MDSFMNLAKQGYAAYEQSQGQHGGQQQQGGQQQGYGNDQQGGGGNQEYYQGGQGNQQYGQGNQGYGQGGGQSQGGSQYNDGPSQGGIDVQAAARHAEQSDNTGSGGMFQNAMGYLNKTQQNGDTDVDEGAVQDAHRQAYQQGNAGSMDASSMGAAAAMQAMKRFTGGNSSGSGQGGQSGGFQSKLIGMAMQEASQLFDQSGGAANGGKQDAINSAGATVMKLLLKNQVSGIMGGSSSGGLSSMLGA